MLSPAQRKANLKTAAVLVGLVLLFGLGFVVKMAVLGG